MSNTANMNPKTRFTIFFLGVISVMSVISCYISYIMPRKTPHFDPSNHGYDAALSWRACAPPPPGGPAGAWLRAWRDHGESRPGEIDGKSMGFSKGDIGTWMEKPGKFRNSHV